MRTRKVWFIVCGISLVALVGAGLWAGAVQAQPPRQEPAGGTTISYPGRLTGPDGQPVADGDYALAFALYTAPEGGEPFWTEAQERIPVQGGHFGLPFTGRVAPPGGRLLLRLSALPGAGRALTPGSEDKTQEVLRKVAAG